MQKQASETKVTANAVSCEEKSLRMRVTNMAQGRRKPEEPNVYTFLKELFADVCQIDLSYSEKTGEVADLTVITTTGWRGTPDIGFTWAVTRYVDDSSVSDERISTYNLPGIDIEWSFSWWKSGYRRNFEHNRLIVSFTNKTAHSQFIAIWERVFGNPPVFEPESQ